MGMFNDLMSKIFGHPSATPSAAVTPSGTTIEAATAPSGTKPCGVRCCPGDCGSGDDFRCSHGAGANGRCNLILDGLGAKNSE